MRDLKSSNSFLRVQDYILKTITERLDSAALYKGTLTSLTLSLSLSLWSSQSTADSVYQLDWLLLKMQMMAMFFGLLTMQISPSKIILNDFVQNTGCKW